MMVAIVRTKPGMPREYQVSSHGHVVLEGDEVPEAYRFQYAPEEPDVLHPDVVPADFSSSVIAGEGRVHFHTRKGSTGPEFQVEWRVNDSGNKLEDTAVEGRVVEGTAANFHINWTGDVDELWIGFMSRAENNLPEDALNALDADPLWVFGIGDSATQRALDLSREKKVDASIMMISLESWLKDLEMESLESLTIFQWNLCIDELQEQFKCVIETLVPNFETVARDTGMAHGFFKMFGLTRSEVQEGKLKSEADREQAESNVVGELSESEQKRISALPEREQVREMAMHRIERILSVRRQHEGQLISVPGQPILIIVSGARYSGTSSSASKYRALGMYDVPVGFVSSIKVDGMPAIFMTRESDSGPQFQIVLLPKRHPRPKATSTCCVLQ